MFIKGERLGATKLNLEIRNAGKGIAKRGSHIASGANPIYFANKTGALLRAGDIASISNDLGTYVDGGAYFAELKPVDAFSTYASVVFALQTVDDGMTGLFTHSHVIKAIVDIQDSTHKYASWSAGDTYLTSSEHETEYRIVMPGEVVTGSQKMCVIELNSSVSSVASETIETFKIKTVFRDVLLCYKYPYTANTANEVYVAKPLGLRTGQDFVGTDPTGQYRAGYVSEKSLNDTIDNGPDKRYYTQFKLNVPYATNEYITARRADIVIANDPVNNPRTGDAGNGCEVVTGSGSWLRSIVANSGNPVCEWEDVNTGGKDWILEEFEQDPDVRFIASHDSSASPNALVWEKTNPASTAYDGITFRVMVDQVVDDNNKVQNFFRDITISQGGLILKVDAESKVQSDLGETVDLDVVTDVDYETTTGDFRKAVTTIQVPKTIPAITPNALTSYYTTPQEDVVTGMSVVGDEMTYDHKTVRILDPVGSTSQGSLASIDADVVTAVDWDGTSLNKTIDTIGVFKKTTNSPTPVVTPEQKSIISNTDFDESTGLFTQQVIQGALWPITTTPAPPATVFEATYKDICVGFEIENNVVKWKRELSRTLGTVISPDLLDIPSFDSNVVTTVSSDLGNHVIEYYTTPIKTLGKQDEGLTPSDTTAFTLTPVVSDLSYDSTSHELVGDSVNVYVFGTEAPTNAVSVPCTSVPYVDTIEWDGTSNEIRAYDGQMFVFENTSVLSQRSQIPFTMAEAVKNVAYDTSSGVFTQDYNGIWSPKNQAQNAGVVVFTAETCQ